MKNIKYVKSHEFQFYKLFKDLESVDIIVIVDSNKSDGGTSIDVFA